MALRLPTEAKPHFTLPPVIHSKCRPSTSRPPKLVLCSRVRGRERWYIDAVEDNPRLAATVELALRSEEGIEQAVANPLTGRVLIHYRQEAFSRPVQDLILQAIALAPMSEEEFATLTPEKPDGLSAGHFLAAEISCSALKMLVLGTTCPSFLAATGFFLLLGWHRSQGRDAAVRRHPRRLVANQS
jgi:hypothetical protein